ncbi:MAG: T9SS type A sorting domain-containing protein [Ignavibacteria bacterium]|nr:T9SS type A sorting domain-containing protein [Ignavibacteria bacterium]MBT8382264.1 T9SS type A sorting domain-containing protein [Ignavibacteria bacterium]NNL19953.1 T9SS type A sorting domain-containing protein [Ignavibacteriaceae bacterium]
MLKRSYMVILTILLTLSWSFSLQAQDFETKLLLDGYTLGNNNNGNNVTSDLPEDAQDIEASNEGQFQYQVDPNWVYTSDGPDALLYDNGPALNVPGGGPVAGSDLSLLENTTLGMSTLGFGHQLTATANNRIADQFTIPSGETWTIDSLAFYAYQTNGGIPSTITAVNVRIWDGDPSAGGTVVWGDTATNVLANTYFSNIYRHSESSPGTTRAMMRNVCAVGTMLSEGTYWVDWQAAGSASSGPWAPPIVILGTTTTGDGLQYLGSSQTWQAAIDNGSAAPQGFPFEVWGTSGGGGPVAIWEDDFNDSTVSAGNWNAAAWGDVCDWGWYTTSTWVSGLAPVFPPTSMGGFAGVSSDACGTAQVVNAYLTGNVALDLSDWSIVTVHFEGDMQVFSAPVPADTGAFDMSTDGGATWTRIIDYSANLDLPAIDTTFDVSSTAALQSDVRFRFCYYGDFSWHFAIDNFAIFVDGFIPVELSSFTASVSERDVTLNWTTSTETNNQGFEVERNSGNGFENIGYLPGFGTTTEPRSYTFTDVGLSAGSYTYRLKQIDFDGSFSYSDEVQTEILTPDVYALDQNYPNPFNPSTKITFSLAVDSKVSLKIFDVLGQEVLTLVNEDLSAGSYNYDFNATNINSGIYFYKIEAEGINGSKFVDVKKMTFLK